MRLARQGRDVTLESRISNLEAASNFEILDSSFDIPVVRETQLPALPRFYSDMFNRT